MAEGSAAEILGVEPEGALSCATCGWVFPDIASAVVDPCLCGVGGAPLTRLRDAAAGSADQPKEEEASA